MKKKNVLSVFLILIMCFLFCACGSQKEKTHPLVGEWQTEFIINDEESKSRAEILELGVPLYVDVIVNEDMTYTMITGNKSTSGTVSIAETKDGEIYTFLSVGFSGIIVPENPTEMLITSEMLEPYSFLLKKK